MRFGRLRLLYGLRRLSPPLQDARPGRTISVVISMRHVVKRSRSPKMLRLTGEVWREGQMYTAYCRELDLASCGRTVEEAWRNLHEAFEIFLEETAKKGTLQGLLEEAGLVAQGETLERPEYFIGRLELPLPASR
ncbi:MAG: hypothetical protein K6T71_00110 [Candidatus Bipolaricaulota bacterium]|nr:hypothetical protein [Candidatus Bipolaricaulota bacterium]